MAYESISYDKPQDGVARITLNRPESLNALTIPMVYEIYEAAAEAQNDPEVVVLIYRGAGRAFCAGRDFKYSAKLQTEDPEGWFAWRRRWRAFGPQTWTFPKATIAQVHGYVLGGGHVLAVSCDITVAGEDARFGYPEARYGTLSGGTHLWNWLIGPKKTKEYVLTGRNFGAQEALTAGLINQVVPNDQLDDTVMAIAQDIVAIERKHPGYVAANKSQINSRHLELMMYTYINPDVVARMPEDIEYTMNLVKSQEEFFTEVARDGMESALKNMHKGFSSRT